MELKLDIFQTMALVTVVFYLGTYLRKKVRFLSKYCIPSPVVGGLLFSLVMLFFKVTNLATIVIDTTLQNLFMTAFFASVGFTASFKILKNGGIKVAIFLGVAVLLVISQDIVGATLAKVFNLNPLLGLCTGSISMVGGHGTAGSFGPLLEELGVNGATTVSFASATFGLVMGSFIGGFVAKNLIENYKLKTPKESGLVMGSFIGGFVAKNLIENYKLKTPKESKDHSIPLSDFHEDNQAVLCHHRLMNGSAYLFFAMGIGSIISNIIQDTGLTFPSYIGAMIAAAIIRNFCDIRKLEIEEKEIEVIGNISLSYFLCIALMGLRLWELLQLLL